MPDCPKYTLRQMLFALPKDRFFDVKYEILKSLKKTEQTLDRWMKIQKTDRAMIPDNDLYVIAEKLNCKPQDLYNW